MTAKNHQIILTAEDIKKYGLDTHKLHELEVTVWLSGYDLIVAP
jgi:hypothetical protein